MIIHTNENLDSQKDHRKDPLGYRNAPGSWKLTLVTVSTFIHPTVPHGSQVSLELSRAYVLQESFNFISSGRMFLPEGLGLLSEGHSHCPRESLLVKGEEVLSIVAKAPEASSAPIFPKLTAQGFLEDVKAWPAPGRDLSLYCPLVPLILQSKRD